MTALQAIAELDAPGALATPDPPEAATAAAGPDAPMALVLAGGIALGAYAAGVYAALDEAGRLPDWICGASIGAVTAALIAGNPPGQRRRRLRRFWEAVTDTPLPLVDLWFGAARTGPLRATSSQASVLQTIMMGRPGLFRPRLATPWRVGAFDTPALYDLAPLRAHLTELIDFDLLNDGPVRLTVVATDVVSGERVVFDNRLARIGPDHLLASCALLPLFAPVEVAGRLLGDGALASNLPLDVVLADPAADGMLCVAVELFAPPGQRPHTLAASLSRATDLIFGNQSLRLLEAQAREQRLRAALGVLGDRLQPEMRAEAEVADAMTEARARPPRLVTLGYRAGLDEAGAGKMFDFSRVTLDERWARGAAETRRALAALDGSEDGEAGAWLLRDAAGRAAATCPGMARLAGSRPSSDITEAA